MLQKFIRKVKRLVVRNGNYGNYGNYNGYSWLDYYENLNVIDNRLSALANLLNTSIDASDYISSKRTFKPFGLTFDTSYSSSLKICGKPNYSIDNSVRIETCKVLFYKKRIGNIKLTTQLHFFEEKLFLAKTDFSNTQSNESIHERIAKLALKKYADIDLVSTKPKVILRDENNSELTIDLLSVHPSIVYVSGNKEVSEKILMIINAKKIDRTSKEKLINDELFNRL